MTIDGWLDLWNGRLELAPQIVTADFCIHAAMLDGSDSTKLRGPEGLTGWIVQTRAAFTSLTYAIEVGPIAQGDHVAVHWSVTGRYAGGFPGATAEPGTPIAFTGTDVLRTEDGKFAEYWVNSDMHVLLAQLGQK